MNFDIIRYTIVKDNHFLRLNNRLINITDKITKPFNQFFKKSTKTYEIDGENFKVNCIERI